MNATRDRLSKDNLSNELDTFYLSLLKEATASITSGADQPDDAPPPIGFLDRLRLFSEGVRWAAVKAKVETEDVTDQFGQLRAGLVGGTRKRGAAGTSAARSGDS